MSDVRSCTSIDAQTTYDNIDTYIFTTSLEYAYLSSSTVREAAFYGADISRFVPESVVNQVYERLKDKGEKNE
mgnify:CR=1 FL=1